MEKKFLIIDANSLIHRAYHALPPLKDSSGKAAGALYGISSVLLKIYKEIPLNYIAAAFDRPEPVFRKKEYLAYKENRPKTPDDLVHQIVSSKDIFKNFGINCFDYPGYEADDIIGTITFFALNSKEFIDGKNKIIILSGDMDILQLVKDDCIIVWIPQKGVSSFTEYNKEKVIQRFGVIPERIPDFKGLTGDSSDNIPGIEGVGPKKAADIIQKYGQLEDLYDLLPEAKTETLKNILNGKEKALLSKKLATILRNVPINISSLDDFLANWPKPSQLSDFLLSKGFRTLSERANHMHIYNN